METAREKGLGNSAEIWIGHQCSIALSRWEIRILEDPTLSVRDCVYVFCFCFVFDRFVGPDVHGFACASFMSDCILVRMSDCTMIVLLWREEATVQVAYVCRSMQSHFENHGIDSESVQLPYVLLIMHTRPIYLCLRLGMLTVTIQFLLRILSLQN